MVPTWTLAIAAVAGVAVGVVVGRLIPRPKPPASEAAASQEPAVESAGVPVEGSTTAEGEPAGAEVPRIGMEDVVTELERRYQGRRADEERERARRKRDREPPPPQR